MQDPRVQRRPGGVRRSGGCQRRVEGRQASMVHLVEQEVQASARHVLPHTHVPAAHRDQHGHVLRARALQDHRLR